MMDHSAVPLPDGTVLVTGGANREALLGADQPAATNRAWRYQPGKRIFEATGPMVEARVHHTGTLMMSGKVLLTGGSDRQTPLGEASFECPKVGDSLCQRCVGKPSAEIYDPVEGTFTRIDMPTPRSCHTATLLADDSVLLVGGGGEAVEMNVNAETGAPVAGLSLFRDGAFVELPTRLTSPRLGHVAVHRPDVGQILVAFGRDAISLVAPPKTGAVLAEIIDVEALLSNDPPTTTLTVPCGPADPQAAPDRGVAQVEAPAPAVRAPAEARVPGVLPAPVAAPAKVAVTARDPGGAILMAPLVRSAVHTPQLSSPARATR